MRLGWMTISRGSASAMWSRVSELTGRLTPDERHSLEELDQGPIRAQIPFQHAERLISLGLAELSLGRLDLTIAGRQLLGTLRGA